MKKLSKEQDKLWLNDSADVIVLFQAGDEFQQTYCKMEPDYE